MPFDPNKSKVSEDSLVHFLSSPIYYDIKTVPGIGAGAEKKFKEHDIENTYQLIAAFLFLKKTDMTCQEHLDAFWFFLSELGINSHRSGIVHSLASKLDIMMPGIYEFSHDSIS